MERVFNYVRILGLAQILKPYFTINTTHIRFLFPSLSSDNSCYKNVHPGIKNGRKFKHMQCV